MPTTLAVVLNHHLAKSGWSFEKLAEEVGLPRNTVYRWTKGEVRRVRHWQDLAKVARGLDLNRFQTDALLKIGGHPTVGVLLDRATDEADRELLSRWISTSLNNLPAPLTTFIGRHEELERLTWLLSSVRLVTLTGPGGSGKTRLALEAAHAVLDEFDECYFVDLAHVRNPELVIPTISQTLGLGESLDESPLQALKAYLRDRKVLLVLDNLEQVIEVAPLVTELLSAARWVNALVTSRARLNVRGEHEFWVPPLPLPRPASSLEELALNPSVALFADRARAVNSSFTLTPSSAPIVAELCVRQEGLPLGIELAAARIRQMGLRSMLERFPDRLLLASGGPRDLPHRQRTLRATIAWSYDLLGCGEQRLLNRTGVFSGGFTEEAARSVCTAIGQLEIEVSEALESLVEQSLLRRVCNREDEPRYEMLETIREYALENLKERGESEAALRAHAEYYVRFTEQADLEGEGQATWLHRLVAEHDNLRAALEWCRERSQIETGLRLCIALMPLWQLRDHQVEARTWLETFLVAEGKVSPNLRAKGLLWRGLLTMRGTGDGVSTTHLFDEALVLFRDGGDLNGASETLQAEGDVCRNQGELKLASQRYAESLELAKQTGNSYLVAHGWMGLALCAQEEGQFTAAKHHWASMLEWSERAGNRASMALALNSLGEMARHGGDWEEAESYYEQTLNLARELGNESRTALALHNLGYVALYRGELERAGTFFTDGLSLYQGRHYHKGVAECLAGLGKVEASKGRLERAARLCGATETILEGLGTRLDTLDRADYERTLGTLKSRLGERLNTLLDEGRVMSMEKAVEYAVAVHCTKG
ncbi:MAG: tetratricopeptide repeat protein [Thermomicrobiales bacterium]